MAKGFGRSEPLASTEWLAERLGEPELRIYDCTVHLPPDPPRLYKIVSGRPGYDAGHIPGAEFLDLQHELSDPDAGLDFMLPTPERFAEAMSRRGLGAGHTAVLYAQGSPMWATRAWWMLRAMGFDRARVLDGGLTKWKAEGRPLSAEPARYPPARFEARPRPELMADKSTVRRALGDTSVCLLSARSRELFEGATYDYGRRGRIPGSVNVPAGSLVDEHQAYLPPERLRAVFQAAGVEPGRRVIAYCGAGIAATSDAFALHLLGHEAVAVYDGSISDWSRDPDLPMETGR